MSLKEISINQNKRSIHQMKMISWPILYNISLIKHLNEWHKYPTSLQYIHTLQACPLIFIHQPSNYPTVFVHLHSYEILLFVSIALYFRKHLCILIAIPYPSIIPTITNTISRVPWTSLILLLLQIYYPNMNSPIPCLHNPTTKPQLIIFGLLVKKDLSVFLIFP